MKKLFILVLVLFCMTSIGYAYRGDSLGDHKLKRTLEGDNHAADRLDGKWIYDVGEGSETAVSRIYKINEAAGITKGQIVFKSGSTGVNIQIQIADAFDKDKDDPVGIADESGANNDRIRVKLIGEVTGLNTNHLTEGGKFYLGPNGETLDDPPSSGTVRCLGLVCRKHINQGVLTVVPYELMNQITGGVGEDVIVRMGDGARAVVKDGQDNILWTITKSSWIITGNDRVAVMYYNLKDFGVQISTTVYFGDDVIKATVTIVNGRIRMDLGDLYASATVYAAVGNFAYGIMRGNLDMGGNDIHNVDAIYWNDGTVQVSSPTGGGDAGNVNRDKMIPAELFNTSNQASGNVASIHEINISETYDNVATSVPVITIKLPDDDNHNFAFTKDYTSLQWDDSTFPAYVPCITTGTQDTANMWINLGVSTCPTGPWTIYQSTTATGSGLCDVRFATFTITGILDGYPLYFGIGRRGDDDPADMEIHALGVIVDPDVD